MSSAAAPNTRSSETTGNDSWAGRLDVYGVFWVRFLDWGVRRCPFFIEPLLLFGYTALFFGLAGTQRRAVIDNLATLCPGVGWFGRWWRSARVFWEFAWMIVDASRARHGERHVTWRLDGPEPFREASGAGGALLLTAHMGNYDVAGPFFADKFGRTMHGVRRPERRADLQGYMDEQRKGQASEGFRIQYNTEGGFLAVELAQALASGEVVAIQGDRVIGQMGTMEWLWRERLWRLPSGPLVLAQVAGVPIFPVFSIRDGWRSYRILFLPARMAGPPPGDRAARQAGLKDLAQWWADTLAGVLERHWAQWLMFEEAFASPPQPTGAGSSRHWAEVHARPLPCTSSVARPERGSAEGWELTDRPISRTYLGRWLNAGGYLLPGHSAHQLRAEDSAQNWIEVVVLAGFSGLLIAAGVWMALAAWLPWGVTVILFPLTWFAFLHALPLACGAVADLVKRLPGVPHQWTVIRISEELIFAVQTAVSVGLLWTSFRWVAAAWLAFALANGFALIALARSSRAPSQSQEKQI